MTTLVERGPRHTARLARITPLAIGLLAVGLSAAMSGCSDSGNDASPPPPPTVEVATPQIRSVTEYFNYTGTLESVAQVEIRARVTGFLEEVRFDESTDVEAGEVLFAIEREPYEVEVGLAQAALARAEAQRSLAEARLARVEEAFAAQAASELEKLEAEAGLEQADADVLAAKEELAAAELDLSYTLVESPISGRVDRNYVDPGNLVGREGATLLARVVTLDPMRVSFDVSESIALQYLAAGDDGSVDNESPPVEVGLADEDGFPHPGRVDFVDSILDESTGTLRVRAVLPNPTSKLYPGLFARIRVPWETRENAVLVFEEAVGTGLEGKFLLVLDDTNTVSRRSITLGERQGDGTIVVLEGLEAGETYIVRGLQKARPGAPVDPKPFGEEAESEADGGDTQ